MTVYELIQKLLECDTPDTTVRIAHDKDASRPFINDVFYEDIDGPVFLEIGDKETK